jgi:hypothetical protein
MSAEPPIDPNAAPPLPIGRLALVTAAISGWPVTPSLHSISADTRATCAAEPVAPRTRLNAALIGTTSTARRPGRSGATPVIAKRQVATPGPGCSTTVNSGANARRKLHW